MCHEETPRSPHWFARAGQLCFDRAVARTRFHTDHEAASNPAGTVSTFVRGAAARTVAYPSPDICSRGNWPQLVTISRCASGAPSDLTKGD
jgi:hypothetical protein